MSNLLSLPIVKKQNYCNEVLFRVPELLNKNDSIDVFLFPTITRNALKNNGIETVEQLLEYPQNQLKNLKSIGEKMVLAVGEIKEIIGKKQLLGNDFDIIINNKKMPGITGEPIDTLPVPSKMMNALKRGGILTMDQFCNYPGKNLYYIRGIGSNSAKILIELKNKINKKRNHTELVEINDGNLFKTRNKYLKKEIITKEKLVDYLLEKCGDNRNKDILLRRCGLYSDKKQTLKEIGEFYGLSKERIRQILEQDIKRLHHGSVIEIKKQILEIVEKLRFDNNGVISEKTAEKLVPKYFGNIDYKGTLILNLLCELKWYKSYQIKDLVVYKPIVKV